MLLFHHGHSVFPLYVLIMLMLGAGALGECTTAYGAEASADTVPNSPLADGTTPKDPSTTEDPATALLNGNRKWAADTKNANHTFFEAHEKGQSPKVLLIGCSDSRFPETMLTDAQPGDIFVQRNIANQYLDGDTNVEAVVSYAVAHLGVEHVVIAGHTECGGVKASYEAAKRGADDSLTLADEPKDAPLNKWLQPITKMAKEQLTLAKREDLSTDPLTLLVQENVKAQVNRIADSSVLKAAWEKHRSGTGPQVTVYGWVYNLGTGLITDLGNHKNG